MDSIAGLEIRSGPHFFGDSRLTLTGNCCECHLFSPVLTIGNIVRRALCSPPAEFRFLVVRDQWPVLYRQKCEPTGRSWGRIVILETDRRASTPPRTTRGQCETTRVERAMGIEPTGNALPSL
jgi:hypothetical protein